MGNVIETKRSDFSVFMDEFNDLSLSSVTVEKVEKAKIPEEKLIIKKSIFPFNYKKKEYNEYIMVKNKSISLLYFCLELQKFIKKIQSEAINIESKLSLTSKNNKNKTTIFFGDDVLTLNRGVEELQIICDNLPEIKYQYGFKDYDDIKTKEYIYDFLKSVYFLKDFIRCIEKSIAISLITNMNINIIKIFDGKVLMDILIGEFVIINIEISIDDIKFSFFTPNQKINEFLASSENFKHKYSLLEKIFIPKNKVSDMLNTINSIC